MTVETAMSKAFGDAGYGRSHPRDDGLREKVYAQVETINPQRAAALLATNPSGNRHQRLARIQKLVNAIEGGRWKLNGETIVVASGGRLLDGQHRLAACVSADLPILTVVVYGIDPSVFATLDTGLARTAGDVLHIAVNPGNETRLAAGIRWIASYRGGALSPTTLVMDSDEVEAFFRGLGEAQDGILKSCVLAGRASGLLAPGLGVALHFLFAEKSATDADKFFEDLASGEGLQRGDPVLILREQLQKNRSKTLGRNTMSRSDLFCRCIRAWNARRAGQSVLTLKGLITGASTQPRMV